MSEHIIKVENLRKSFKVGNSDLEILKGVSFNIEKGEFVSIMGPSGCGKSRLLYLMGGLDSSTSGSVFINGIDYSVASEKERCLLRRRDLGFVFQFYNLVQNLTVEENILLPILLDRRKEKEYKQKLDEILDIIEMSSRRKHKPSELSGGQQQRVAIARALLFEPDIILADEPIGNLDSKTGSSIMEIFKRINLEYGTTIVQVTHSEEHAKIGSKILYMKDGQIDKLKQNKMVL